MLDAALDNHVQAIWLAFGTKIGKWVEYVRQADNATGGTWKTLIFVLVNSLEEAFVAANEWKADVLVAQGAVFFSMNAKVSNLTGLLLSRVRIRGARRRLCSLRLLSSIFHPCGNTQGRTASDCSRRPS